MKNSMPTGGISGSEELPALRRYRICCQARGQQWQVRGHCVYPIEVSGLRGKRTEKLHSTYNCGLTARPVVLARTYKPGSITLPTLKGWSGLDVFIGSFDTPACRGETLPSEP
jgi:hypothetical protein